MLLPLCFHCLLPYDWDSPRLIYSPFKSLYLTTPIFSHPSTLGNMGGLCHTFSSYPKLFCILCWPLLVFNPNSLPIPEKAMTPHSSTLAWKIPWMEEPGRLQSMGTRRVRHDWATSLSLFTFLHWRRKWQPTPVVLPGESQGWGSLVAAVYGVTQSRTRLKWLSSSSIANSVRQRQYFILCHFSKNAHASV